MSKAFVLEQIARMERLADAIARAPNNQVTSLGGQAGGAFLSAKAELQRMGAWIANEELGNSLTNLGKTKEEIVFIIHCSASYLRGLVARI